MVFNLQLIPGKTSVDSVTVANISSTPQDFLLYAADAFNTPGGGLSLTRRVDQVQGIGSWIRLSHSAVSVPAHRQSVIPFLVVVPANASPGDHLGGIVAEQASGTPSSAGNVPVNVVQAVGVRVYGRVGGSLKPHLRVTPPWLAVTDTVGSLFGKNVEATVSFRVVNDGNVVLTPRALVKVSGTLGTATSHAYDLGPLLPGSDIVVRHAIGIRAKGELQTRATVMATGARAAATSTYWLIPWALVGLAAFALIVALALVLFLRHRRLRRVSLLMRTWIWALRVDRRFERTVNRGE